MNEPIREMGNILFRYFHQILHTCAILFLFVYSTSSICYPRRVQWEEKGGYGKSRNRWIFWTKFQYGICVEHIYDCKSYVFQWLRNVLF